MSPLDTTTGPAAWLEARYEAAAPLRTLHTKLTYRCTGASARWGWDSEQSRTAREARDDVAALLVEIGEVP